jgi:hypothetical protein
MKKKRSTKKESTTTADNLESRFDRGEGVLDYFETENRRVGVDLPPWAIRALDQEAARRGITRQALIKTWLVDRLDLLEKGKKAS